jgi:hypothetical protein
MQRFGNALLFEALYFLLLLPAGLNHIVGSAVSSSQFLNTYTGASFMLQAVLVFPQLLLLSRKLKQPQQVSAVLRWTCIVGVVVFALDRQGFSGCTRCRLGSQQQGNGRRLALLVVHCWLHRHTAVAVVVFWQKRN